MFVDSKDFVITMTAGTNVDDYEFGVLFSVETEEQAYKITDILNQYSVFRNRMKDEVIVWQVDASAHKPYLKSQDFSTWISTLRQEEEEFIKTNFPTPEDLKLAELLLKQSGVDYSPVDWPEEVAFAYKTIPCYSLTRLEE